MAEEVKFWIVVNGKPVEARADKNRGKRATITWNKARAISDDGKLYPDRRSAARVVEKV